MLLSTVSVDILVLPNHGVNKLEMVTVIPSQMSMALTSKQLNALMTPDHPSYTVFISNWKWCLEFM